MGYRQCLIKCSKYKEKLGPASFKRFVLYLMYTVFLRILKFESLLLLFTEKIFQYISVAVFLNQVLEDFFEVVHHYLIKESRKNLQDFSKHLGKNC